jgi:CDP-glucose 4,6-dehydratase
MLTSWRDRRVLVTGATGIVGSHLCAKLVDIGAYVFALVRDDDPHSSFYRDGIAQQCSIVRGELQSFDTCMRAINGHDVDVVFHLGAQTLVETALRDPLETFESNLRGTYNLLEAARRLGIVKAFVVASSDKAYGDSVVLPYTEDMPLVGRHPYDVSKSCTDLLSTCYSVTYDLPVTIARCGNIYGSGDLNWSRIVPGTIRSILAGQRPILRSNGTNIRDYIYVADVVSAYLALAEQIDHPQVRGGAFNFSPETQVDVFGIVSAISRVMESSLEPLVLNTATHEIKDQTLDARKARNVLGWTPSWSLDAGLRETVPWYRDILSSTGGAGSVLAPG